MISFYNIDFSPLLDLSFSSIVIEDIRSEWTVNIHSLANASGMTYSEVLDFLDSKEVGHNAFKTSHDAVVELRDWYLKKVRRYVRNGLALELDPGSQDEILFLQFCDRYRKIGCNEVKSWDDIDETRLLQDFEAKCLYDLPLFAADLR